MKKKSQDSIPSSLKIRGLFGCKLHTIVSQTLYTNAFELLVFDTKRNMLHGIKKWADKHSIEYSPVDFCSAIVIENANRRIITQGDNNSMMDCYQVTVDEYWGKVDDMVV